MREKWVSHKEVNEKIKEIMLGKGNTPLHCKISFNLYLYQGKNNNMYYNLYTHYIS